MPEHVIRLNQVNQTQANPSDGSVLIECHDGNAYTLTFASVRHALDLISAISDAQGWMVDNEVREMEADLAGDHWSIPKIRTRVVLPEVTE